MSNKRSEWLKKQRYNQKQNIKQIERAESDLKEIMNFAEAVTTVVRNKDDGYLSEVLRQEFKFGDVRINRVLEALNMKRKQVTKQDIDKAKGLLIEGK